MFGLLDDLQDELMHELYTPKMLKEFERDAQGMAEPKVANGPDGSSKVNILKPLRATESFRLQDISAVNGDNEGEAYDVATHD